MPKVLQKNIFSFFVFFVSTGLAIALATNSISGAAESFTFTAAGDFGASTYTTSTLTSMGQENGAFSVAVGDFSYSEITPESAWCDYIKGFFPANYPFQLLAGNHEDDNGADGSTEIFAACLPDQLSSVGAYAKEYYYDYPQTSPLVRVINISPDLALDGGIYDYSVGSARYNWVSQTIDDARNAGIKWVVVGMHKVCISMGAMSCDVGTDVMDLLISKKVDLVLQGHDHNYQRSKQLALNADCSGLSTNAYNSNCVADDGSAGYYVKDNGTVILIVGTAGKYPTYPDTSDTEAGYFASWMTPPPSNTRTNGYARFNVSATEMSVDFIPTVGSYTDSFNIYDAAFVPSPTPVPTPTPPTALSYLNPIADAQVKEAYPTKNYGTNTNLTSSDYSSGNTKVSYIKFDLAAYAGQTLTSAKLILTPDLSRTVEKYVYTTDQSWIEGSIDWNTRPANINQIGYLAPTSVSSGTPIEVSLGATEVQNMFGGELSLAVENTGYASTLSFNSREAGSVGPVLELSVVTATSSATPSPSPSSTPTPSPVATPTPIPTATPTPTSTPTPPSVVSFVVSKDATLDETSPDTNFSTEDRLWVDDSPNRDILMEFDTTGFAGNVISVKLRIYAVDGSNVGGDIYSTNTGWIENAVTWNNSPQPSNYLKSIGNVSKYSWYEIDITNEIQLGSPAAFRIVSDHRNGADYASKESLNPPQLVVTYN